MTTKTSPHILVVDDHRSVINRYCRVGRAELNPPTPEILGILFNHFR